MRLKFLTMLAHRVNYYSGILIYTVNIGSYYFLWLAIYAGSGTLGGLTATQMVTYLAIAWMARSFYFNNLDREIAEEIRTGAVAVQLVRPYPYLTAKWMEALGEALFRLLFFAVPGMALASLIFPVQVPTQPASWGAYAVALLLSLAVNTQINIITGLAAFFFLHGQGMMHAKRVLVDLFSGLFLPITFYPLWAQAVLQWLPFQAISYLPSLVFTGALQGAQMWRAVAIQLAWIAILALATRVLWSRATRRLIIQGG